MLYKWLLTPFLAPIAALLTNLFDGVGPLLKGFSQALVVLVAAVWEGFLDMVDNWKSILFVLMVGLCVGYYSHEKTLSSPKTCADVVKKLHKDYKFVPRKNTKTSSTWNITPWSL